MTTGKSVALIRQAKSIFQVFIAENALLARY
jgi:hypothetical protein